MLVPAFFENAVQIAATKHRRKQKQRRRDCDLFHRKKNGKRSGRVRSAREAKGDLFLVVRCGLENQRVEKLLEILGLFG